jgi:hypothetical protein
MIATLAARQHGNVAHRQLRALGLGDDAIDYRLRAGRLHVVHRGVYAVGYEVLTVHGQWMAAVLACGPGAVLSHRDAAALWRLLPSPSASIHVITRRSASHDRSRITVHRPRLLHPDDRSVCHRIPVTSVARTLFDIAPMVSPSQLERAWDESELRRLFDLRAVEAVRERSRGSRGVRAIDELLRDARPLPAITRSELERAFVRLCREYGIPEPSANIWIEGYQVDMAWPDQRLVVELDGGRYHDTRAARRRDPIRDVKL